MLALAQGRGGAGSRCGQGFGGFGGVVERQAGSADAAGTAVARQPENDDAEHDGDGGAVGEGALGGGGNEQPGPVAEGDRGRGDPAATRAGRYGWHRGAQPAGQGGSERSRGRGEVGEGW